MARLIYFSFLLLMPLLLFAQVKFSGTVLEQNKKPFEFVEVVLINQKQITVKSELTNELGKFLITVDKGNYQLQILQEGKVLYASEIDLNQNLNSEIQVITSTELKAVIITAKKKLIERKIDRLVFNVENSIQASGGDALDLLKVTPNIRVQNDQIAMLGKNKMSIMIDGKLMQLSGDDLINFLKTIASDNIKSIEVITTPPAKYDAEGNSGIVNIKLKKAKNDSWSTTLRNSTTLASHLRSANGVNIMFQKNKWTVLADVAAGDAKYIYTNDGTYTYPNNQFWDASIRITNRLKYISPTLNVDYQVNKKWAIGIQYVGSLDRQKGMENYKTQIFTTKAKQFLQELLQTNGTNKENTNTQSLNFNSIYKLDTIGKKITFDVDYFNNDNVKDNPFFTANSNFVNNEQSDFYTNNRSQQLISNISTRVDFEMPFTWASLNYGFKISNTQTNSKLNGDFFQIINQNTIPYLTQNTLFEYAEKNQAVYFSAQKELSKKWDAKFGLRLENTQTSGYNKELNTTNSNKYTKLFLSVYLVFKPFENHSFTMDYSRRIERPAYWQLNPAKWYQNLNSIITGNPFLQPSFNHNFSLAYGYKTLSSTSVWLSLGENGTGQLTTTTEKPNELRTVFENYFSFTNFGITENLNFNVFKWWTSASNITLSFNRVQANTSFLDPNYRGVQSDFNTSNTFVLNKNKTLKGELNYYQYFTSTFGETKTTNYSSVDIGFKYALYNNKLNVTLLLNNILNSDRVFNSDKIQGIEQTNKQYYDSRFIRLSLSYKFGSSKIAIESKTGSNEEEKQRSGK